MNREEEIYFEELSRDREESADLLEKPSMRGIKKSVVEKYSDQAHFIYELLQNADDAKATKARFKLYKDYLVFAHNGSRHFSISNPNKEEEDSEKGMLGDINAITSIANSNKTKASIGKFGVGFKAVFQYTSTPQIYDPNICFKIERFIVPRLIKEDFPERQTDETLFVFPFDHTERGPVESYRDISEKLKNLSFPLLFLTSLKNIELEFDNVIGLYSKSIKKTYQFDDVVAEKICLSQNNGEDFYDYNLWLFSKHDENNNIYSVGYFIDDKDNLCPLKETAFCFFPTKEVTGLKFIIHAPFLLTDSREGIRAGVEHNDYMIKLLAKLSADALVYLKEIGKKESQKYINDNILSIIPIDPDDFSDPNDKRKISFLPFYESIFEKMSTDKLLPSNNGYVSKENAYWAENYQYNLLFSDNQLSYIVENDNAKWVFNSLSRYEISQSNKVLFNYIESLVRTYVNEDIIINGRSRENHYNRILKKRVSLEPIKGISPEFIENQTIEWLHKFYKWISDTKHRTIIAKNKPIFLNQNRKAIAAFDKKDQPILFLPIEEINNSEFNSVYFELLENADTMKFIEDIGIKEPSMIDQIYNIILPKYSNGIAFNTDPHFKVFFDYFCNSSNYEVNEFINAIKNCKFIKYNIKDDEEVHYGLGKSIYFPKPENLSFFVDNEKAHFVALEHYENLVGKENKKNLNLFLSKLGVKEEIDIQEVEIDYETSERTDLPRVRSTRGVKCTERRIEGCADLIRYIVENEDKEKSILLWNTLIRIIETKCINWGTRSISSLLTGSCNYFYRSPQSETFDSLDSILLKNSKWMFTSDGDFVTPDLIILESLVDEYSTKHEASKDLIDFLNIRTMEEWIKEDNSLLTDTQQEKIEFAEKLIASGIETDEDLQEFLEFKRKKEAKKKGPKSSHNLEENSDCDISQNNILDNGNDSYDIEEVFMSVDNNIDFDSEQYEKPILNSVSKGVIKDIVNLANNKSKTNTNKNNDLYNDFDNVDHDELIPSTVDYNRLIEVAKQKSAEEIGKISQLEELQNKANSVKKYSFAWFNTLLQMESLNSYEKNMNNREVSISFSLIEHEPGTKRIYVLKHPNRYIPQFMEDLTDIPMVLHMGDQKKNIAIEVANIKSYTLRVKLKNSEDMANINLSDVKEISINAKSPAFLLQELREQFLNLNYDDEFDMQQNLNENIEFIFGPPGTGKTTYLAKDILMPLMKKNNNCKVLVLTPTNKAADVLVQKIMELSGENKSYEDWLIRFGTTGDEDIEQSPVYKDKTFDIRNLTKNVTVSTIARFPYDFFMPHGARLFLRDLNWDYIVIDEASMIPLANIIYPIYKKTPNKFIISGDPFQIEPITSIDLWKDENIYTMVGLNSFENPITIPHKYDVKLLTTQYRSISEIGDIFSKLTYGGILKHYRNKDSQKKLNTDLGIETLNILKYPVSKYESIYKAKRLSQSSSYQIYSALFVFEYVCYLSNKISVSNPGDFFTIGIIAPYRTQADIIEKLISSEKLPKEVDIQVGTIHGFQGDECDIVFAIFNTPPYISKSKKMFLNKRNIINVSLSRAKDYLFIVMPDDNTENIGNIHLVNKVESLIKKTDSWQETLTPDLEKEMFGDSSYFENNAFSTTHQNVNVYGLPEKCYEIRTEDNAVDVQIHREFKIKDSIE